MTPPKTGELLVMNVALIDYYRASSWNVLEWTHVKNYWNDCTPAKFLQYRGYRTPHGVFYGSAIQMGRKHFVMQASGKDIPRGCMIVVY